MGIATTVKVIQYIKISKRFEVKQLKAPVPYATQTYICYRCFHKLLLRCRSPAIRKLVTL